MKHDRSRRRDVRRHTDPNVICLPGPRPAPPPAFAPPPRVELEIAGCTATGMPIPDDDQLDAELIAHKNIFDAPPRMSRQARRKALRAEKKAARRAATERFLVGAPSLGDAASQVAMHPSMLIAADEIRDEDAALLEEALLAEVDMMMAEPEPAEPEMADAVEEEALALETIAQIISATGPLIVPSVDIAGQPADNDMPTVLELAPLASLQEICQDRTSEPDEKPMATAAMSPAPQTEIATSSEPVPEVPIEAMTTPLPRHRALVPARRSWLMRLMPWRGPRRSVPVPERALAQLQELRFELAVALRRLDQMIDGAA